MYENYDEAYTKPKCELCGEYLDDVDLYVRFELQVPEPGCTVADWEGHLCESCNGVEIGSPDTRPTSAEIHFWGRDGCELLMIDLKGSVAGTSGRTIRKYTEDTAPDFLRRLGYAAVQERASVRSIATDEPEIDDMNSRLRDAVTSRS
ncbi:hypothetical protein [Natrinema sp. DC36]|uniref:hypothetical protein n=1 Tax=Natrinema sp. DC36 TaxID=2878680 RepID=UPI001CF0B5D7|nr:hypothetical protein [Natrinema sp. DC36]